MRYLLKSGKNPVKIVRQEGALVRRSVWRRRLGAIISVVASGLLATVVTVISTRQEVNLANVEAKQARQREAFTEAWAASELHALEVDRMRRISGLYLLATRLLEANSDNPIAKMFVAEGRAQSLAISTAFKQAESSLAKHQLLLAEEQRYLLRSYLATNERIVSALLSLERREEPDRERDEAGLQALQWNATRLRSTAEVQARGSY